LFRINETVAPTAVTHGHAAGKVGKNLVVFVPSLEMQDAPGPSSPDEKKIDTPRAPSSENRSHTTVR